MTLINYNHKCTGCGIKVGKRHLDGCDHARCAKHGSQLLMEPKKCKKANRYNGFWAGELEAIELGWFVRWGPPWIPCEPDNIVAVPDLNKIMKECKWNSKLERFVPRPKD